MEICKSIVDGAVERGIRPESIVGDLTQVSMMIANKKQRAPVRAPAFEVSKDCIPGIAETLLNAKEELEPVISNLALQVEDNSEREEAKEVLVANDLNSAIGPLSVVCRDRNTQEFKSRLVVSNLAIGEDSLVLTPDSEICSEGEIFIQEGSILTNGDWEHTVTEYSPPIDLVGPANNKISFVASVKSEWEEPSLNPFCVISNPFTVHVPDSFLLEILPENKRSRLAYIRSVSQRHRFSATIRRRTREKLIKGASIQEERAIDTLREMILESEFRKYIVHGFLLVQGASGRIYQIFRNNCHTKVWEKGKIVEEICVRIKDRNVPLTDNVIAFKTMIEASEEDFREIGNVYNMTRVRAVA